jgi:hypothetical protein
VVLVDWGKLAFHSINEGAIAISRVGMAIPTFGVDEKALE